MSDILTDEQVARFQEAFARWDTTQTGRIDARDMADVLRSLGEAPSDGVQLLCQVFQDAEPERITFGQFLSIAMGKPCKIPSIDEELLQIVAEGDDGSGFVGFRSLMRSLHEYLDDGGCCLPDDELTEIYHQILDVSLFENTGGNLDPEGMWAIFEQEFQDLRGTLSASVTCGDVANRAVIDTTCEQPDGHQTEMPRQGNDQTGSIRVTVVDTAGNQLLSDAFPSSWKVEDLKQKVEETVGLPIAQQLLFFAGHGLFPQQGNLSDVWIVDDSIIVLVRKSDLKVDYARFLREFMQVYLENTL